MISGEWNMSFQDQNWESRSFAPEAEKTCEDLLETALKVDADNSEALQSLASVRMSQQRPDDAKSCLEKAWVAWKDLDLGVCGISTISIFIFQSDC